MPSLNRVLLMGNLTRDPELRYLPSNTPVVGFGLAMNRRWRSAEGEQREETTFVDCSAFGRTAELINQFMNKGRPIFIEGRLRLEQWQDRESGASRSKLSVVVESFQFVDSRGGDDPNAGGGSQPARQSQPQPQPRPSGGDAGGGPEPPPHQPVNESDIPF